MKHTTSRKKYSLILASNYLPLSCKPIKKTLRYLINGQGRAMDTETGMLYTFEDWIESFTTSIAMDYQESIRSEKIWMMIPDIVVLDKPYKRHRSNSLKVVPKKVLERDSYTCGYCGKHLAKTWDRTMDHVFPLSKGGPDTYDNVTACCKKCNNQKANKTLKELGWTLRHKLIKPEDSILYHVPRTKWLDSWRDYLKKEMSDFEN